MIFEFIKGEIHILIQNFTLHIVCVYKKECSF